MPGISRVADAEQDRVPFLGTLLLAALIAGASDEKACARPSPAVFLAAHTADEDVDAILERAEEDLISGRIDRARKALKALRSRVTNASDIAMTEGTLARVHVLRQDPESVVVHARAAARAAKESGLVALEKMALREELTAYATMLDHQKVIALARAQPDLTKDASAMLAVSAALTATGRKNEAAKLLLEQQGSNPHARFDLGVIRFEEGHLDRALELMNSVVAEIPDHYYARIYALQIRIEENNIDGIESALRDARKRFKSPELDYLSARVAAAELDHKSAVKLFRSAIATRPDYSESYYGLAKSLRQLGLKSEAKEALSEFRRWHLAQETQQRHASVVEQACQRDKTPASVRRALSFYAENGNNESAIRHAWTLLRLDPKDLASRLQLARSFALSGRATEAAAQYQRILATKPSHEVALTELRQLVESQRKP